VIIQQKIRPYYRHTCICISINIYTYIYVCVCVCVYMYICTCMHVLGLYQIGVISARPNTINQTIRPSRKIIYNVGASTTFKISNESKCFRSVTCYHYYYSVRLLPIDKKVNNHFASMSTPKSMFGTALIMNTHRYIYINIYININIYIYFT